MVNHVSGEIGKDSSHLNLIRTRLPQASRDKSPQRFVAIDFNSPIDRISGGIEHAELALQESVIHRFGKLNGNSVRCSGFRSDDAPGAFVEGLAVRRTNTEWL